MNEAVQKPTPMELIDARPTPFATTTMDVSIGLLNRDMAELDIENGDGDAVAFCLGADGCRALSRWLASAAEYIESLP